jgi:hypothetical protein
MESAGWPPATGSAQRRNDAELAAFAGGEFPCRAIGKPGNEKARESGLDRSSFMT